MAKTKPSQAAPGGPPVSLSDRSPFIVMDRLDWPQDVVCAMQVLKAHADRLQALVDTASQSGCKIGDLAARMDATSGPEPAGACHTI